MPRSPRLRAVLLTLLLLAAAPFTVTDADVTDGQLRIHPAVATRETPVQVVNGSDRTLRIALTVHTVRPGPDGGPVTDIEVGHDLLAVDEVVLRAGHVATLALAAGAPDATVAVTATTDDVTATGYRVHAPTEGELTLDLTGTADTVVATLTRDGEGDAIVRARVRTRTALGTSRTTDLPAVLLLGASPRTVEVDLPGPAFAPVRVDIAAAIGAVTVDAALTVWRGARAALVGLAVLLLLLTWVLVRRARRG